MWVGAVQALIASNDDDAATDLPAHSLSYFFMIQGSAVLGILLMTEQYFGRRINCYTPVSFNQPAKAIGEYCWQHGNFISNTSDSGPVDFNIFPINMILMQSYVYFFLRAIVFLLPHMVWDTKFRQLVHAMVSSAQEAIQEMKSQWINLETAANPDINPDEGEREKAVRASFNAIASHTRDTVELTKRMMPHYRKATAFIRVRMVYDLFFATVYVVMDLSLFYLTLAYDSTDYYCQLLNGEVIRCMVPVMQIQFHIALLAAVLSVIVLAMHLSHTGKILMAQCSVRGKSFLERIPLSRQVSDLSWKKEGNRSTYRIMSMYMMKNFKIVYPLMYVETFVQNSMQKQGPGKAGWTKMVQEAIQKAIQTDEPQNVGQRTLEKAKNLGGGALKALIAIAGGRADAKSEASETSVEA